jgi:phage baseplate assembly protein W
MNLKSDEFLGVGWAFPPSINARGRIAMSRGTRDIEEAIQMILLTPKGQRIMRPEFGCQIHELIFAPNDATTAGLAASYVQEALEMWEPRIEVLKVHARNDEENESRLLIEIDYEVKSTHDSRSLVYPFYRIPESEGREIE